MAVSAAPGSCDALAKSINTVSIRLTSDLKPETVVAMAHKLGIKSELPAEMSLSLGAGEVTIVRRITLPLIMPGLVSGWALSFINSFDEVTMTVFIAGPGTATLPVRMFLYIQDNIDPLVTSVSAALIFLTVIVMIILERLFGLDRLFIGAGR